MNDQNPVKGDDVDDAETPAPKDFQEFERTAHRALAMLLHDARRVASVLGDTDGLVAGFAIAVEIEGKGQWRDETNPPSDVFATPHAGDGSWRDHIVQEVMRTMGAASTCWENLEGAGVFNSQEAIAYGNHLLAEIGIDVQVTVAESGNRT